MIRTVGDLVKELQKWPQDHPMVVNLQPDTGMLYKPGQILRITGIWWTAKHMNVDVTNTPGLAKGKPVKKGK